MGKVKVFLLQRQGEVLTLLRTKKVDEKRGKFTLKGIGKEIMMDPKAFIQGKKYRFFRETWMFANIDNAIPIILNEELKISSQDFRLKSKSDAISNLINSSRNKTYLLIMLGLGICIMIVGAWGIYNMSQDNAKIIQLAMALANATRNSGGTIVP